MEGNYTSGPQLAATEPAPEGTLPGDRWTGTTLGKYQILRRLGKGGMGVVYEAIDQVLQRGVAVKVLREGVAFQQEAVRKFLREARLAARLNHPHVVHVYDADQEKGTCYLVMELMEGGSAHDRIHKWGAFGWVEATQVILDTCRGLGAVHAAGLIHRDIKPSNIMRSNDGTVKLADFGLALASSTVLDRNPSSQVVGTPLYMSPEQCRGLKLDPRSDVYSIGATYYTLLTGKPPFDGETAIEIMQGHCTKPIPDPRVTQASVPQACCDFLCRAMAKNPNERPQNAAGLIVEIEQILALASHIEMPRLEWSSAIIAPIPETVVATESVPKVPRTRLWFIVVSFALMGIAYGAGRYFTRVPEPTNLGPIARKEAPSPHEEDPPAGKSAVNEIDAKGAVTTLAFDPKDTGLLSFGTDNGHEVVMLWGTRSERHTGMAKSGNLVVPVTQVAYSELDRQWITLSHGRLHFFDATDFKPQSEDPALTTVKGADIISVAFHPVLPLVALAIQDIADRAGGVVIRSLDRKEPDLELRGKQGMLIKSLAFSRDGNFLIAGRDNGLLQIWHFTMRKRLNQPDQLQFLRETSTRVGYAPIVSAFPLQNDQFAVACGSEIWRFEAEAGVKKSLIHKADRDISLLARPTTTNRLVCSFGAQVAVIDLTSDVKSQKYAVPKGSITALATSSDGAVIAAGSNQGKIYVWQVK